MIPKSPNAFLAIFGVAFIGIALLSQVAAGGLSVLGSGCGGVSPNPCNPPYANAAFSYANTGLIIQVNDQSSWNSLSLPIVTLQWGDGGVISNQPPGSVLKHAYSSAGTYLLQDSLSGYLGSQRYTSVSSRYISIVPTGNGSGSGGGSSTTYIQVVSFTVTAYGLNATFKDATVLANLTATQVAWTFGDGSTVVGAIGGNVTHGFARSGTFNVSESVTARPTLPNALFVQTKTYSRNVTLTQNGCTSGCGAGGAPASSGPTVQPFALLFGLLGIGFLVAIAFPGAWKLLPVLAGLGLGFLTYVGTGGPI